MRNVTRYCILLTAIFFACIGAATAQSGFYVPKGGKVFFNGDTATIFSNVHNKGKLGVGKKAVVNFKGKKWENAPDARITDETNSGEGTAGVGGTVRFLSDTIRQQIDGGYNAASKSGAAFYRLDIANPGGVELTGSTTKVRHQLQLTKGHVFLQGNILTIGDGSPGLISGYDPSRFIVTGSDNSSMLLRENIARRDDWVVFPVGTNINAYTPAAIRNKSSQGDDYYVNVYNGVQSNLFTGNNLAEKSVNKTWQIGQLQRPGQNETEIMLQHLVADEGAQFALNRQQAYVSQYGTAGWDIGMPQSSPLPGILTSGNPFMINSGINSRSFNGTLKTASYFTKFTGYGDTTVYKTRLWFSAYRMDYLKVKVYWTTKPEVNIRYFVVERRLSNEADFSNRDTLNSQALNRFSNDWLNYENIDPNNYSGISYYRLKMVDYDGNITYSNIVPVGGKPGNNLLIWPNPSSGRFFVGISNVNAIKTIVIWNAIGQLMHKEEVNGRGIIEMQLRTPGTYMVGFITFGGQILDTKKLVITNH
jgi:hypothetical protein